MSSATQTPPAATRDPTVYPVTVAGLLRHWPVWLLTTLLLCAGGIAYALVRDPTYTASAELTVGRADTLATAVPGLDQSAANLAQVYSRLAASDRVVAATARRAGVSRATVRHLVSASPQPASSVFSIDTTSSSQRVAVQLERAALVALTRDIARLESGATPRARVRRRFHRAVARVATLQTQFAGVQGRSIADAVARKRIRRRLSDAQLRQAALTSAYAQATASALTSVGLQVISVERSASSDREAWVQRMALIGGSAGLLLGLTIAFALELRRARRVA